MSTQDSRKATHAKKTTVRSGRGRPPKAIADQSRFLGTQDTSSKRDVQLNVLLTPLEDYLMRRAHQNLESPLSLAAFVGKLVSSHSDRHDPSPPIVMTESADALSKIERKLDGLLDWRSSGDMRKVSMILDVGVGCLEAIQTLDAKQAGMAKDLTEMLALLFEFNKHISESNKNMSLLVDQITRIDKSTPEIPKHADPSKPTLTRSSPTH